MAYRDQNVARQYQRGGDRQATQARENFRGRAESGRDELRGMDRGQLDSRVRDADRGSSQLADRGGEVMAVVPTVVVREVVDSTAAGGGTTVSPALGTALPRGKPASAGRVHAIFPDGVRRQVVPGVVEAADSVGVEAVVAAVVAVEAVAADEQRIHL